MFSYCYIDTIVKVKKIVNKIKIKINGIVSIYECPTPYTPYSWYTQYSSMFCSGCPKCGYSECSIRSRTCRYTELSKIRPSYPEWPTPKIDTIQSPASYKILFRLENNELRDNVREMLQEVTNDVRIEPILQPLTGEEQSIGGNVSVEARAVWKAVTALCAKQIRSTIVFMCSFHLLMYSFHQVMRSFHLVTRSFHLSYALFSFDYVFFSFRYVIILFGYPLFSFGYVLFSFGYVLFSFNYLLFPLFAFFMRSFYVLFLCAFFMCSFYVLSLFTLFMCSFYALFYLLFLCALFMRSFYSLFLCALFMCYFNVLLS